MKLCPRCGRKYPDETLNFCLDDGADLVYGPSDENATKLFGERTGEEHEQATSILPDSSDREQAAAIATQEHSGWARKPLVWSVILAVLALGVVLAWRYQYRPAAGAALNEVRSIAVLPLENLSGDATQEYFSDGMTDALIGDLSQISSLKVTSRTSAMRFKGSGRSLPDIARTLGVDAIVEGSVTRSGNRVRISAQLIPATTDAAIWSRSYEREVSDLLKLQADVAQAIAGEIKAKLTSSEQQRLTSATTVSAAASEEFLLGNYYLQKRTDPNLELAIGHFTRATELEPTYAQAWAGLSDAWFQRGIWGKYSHSDVESAARSAAQRALDLDPGLSTAHISMANLKSNYDWDWPSVEEHSKLAIELDPNNSLAYDSYAWYLLTFGRFDEVRQMMTKAEQLDPVSSNIQSDFGRMLYRARAFEEAETHLNRAVELDENNVTPYGRLADLFLEEGRFDEALSMLEKAEQRGNRDALKTRTAIVYAKMGQQQKARDLWDKIAHKSSGDVARFSILMGDIEAAFSALNRGLDQRETILPHIRVDPAFDRFHGDPRWAQFLSRMNLPPS